MKTYAIWDKPMTGQLATTLLALSKNEDMQKFLEDVMTEKEIEEIAARLEAAKMLSEGKKYTEIISTTKLSSRTIARIATWLKDGSGGYKVALDLINAHHTHQPTMRLIE